MNKVKVLGDRVLVKPEEINDKTEKGLFLPPSAVKNNEPMTGEIVGVGHEASIDVKEGDNVLFKKYAYTTIDYEEVEYFVIDSDDILGIVN